MWYRVDILRIVDCVVVYFQPVQSSVGEPKLVTWVLKILYRISYSCVSYSVDCLVYVYMKPQYCSLGVHLIARNLVHPTTIPLLFKHWSLL